MKTWRPRRVLPTFRSVSSREREHPRYAHEAAITVIHTGRQLQGRTRNVSRGGVCAELVEEVPAGATILVDIQLVFDEDTQSEKLRLPARVAWCTPLDEAYQIGLAWLALHEEQLEYLGLFLKYLDDGAVRERPFTRATTIDERFG